jgi:hypothetical protein
VEAIRARVAVLMAGEAALKRRGAAAAQARASGAGDREAALRLAGAAGLDGQAAAALLAEELARVRALLGEPAVWGQVEAVAGALLRERTLDARDFAGLVGGAPGATG